MSALPLIRKLFLFAGFLAPIHRSLCQEGCDGQRKGCTGRCSNHRQINRNLVEWSNLAFPVSDRDLLRNGDSGPTRRVGLGPAVAHSHLR